MSRISSNPIPTIINLKAIDGPTRHRYETVMDEALNHVHIPNILHGNHVCNDSTHIVAIESYYNDLLHCVQTADLQLPRSRPGTQKSFWNSELST